LGNWLKSPKSTFLRQLLTPLSIQFENIDSIFCGYNPRDLMTIRLSEAADRDAVSASVTSAVAISKSQIIVGELSGQLLQDSIVAAFNESCDGLICATNTKVAFDSINCSEGGANGVSTGTLTFTIADGHWPSVD
jgi:hypothetical protein